MQSDSTGPPQDFTLRFRAVLFDLDGTLADSSQDLVASVQYALRQVDPRDPPDSDTILMEVGKPLEVILREVGYPTDKQSTATFVDEYRRHFIANFKNHTKVFPNTREVLDMLRQVSVRLALVTTKHQVQADSIVAALGLADFFDYVHGWQEGRKHKPDPEPYLTAAERLGVFPAEALVVGDTEQDVVAAQAAGMTSCAVTWGFRPLLMLKALRPDFIISRVTDLVPMVVTPDA